MERIGLLGFGVDIGGSGIKGAKVDLAAGVLASERARLATPQPSTPEAVARVVKDLVEAFAWTGPMGCTFPAAVTGGVARTAANVERSWIGTDIGALMGSATGCDVTAVNDADAAGLAEVTFGAAKGAEGLVLVTTLGTGIGTALIYDGVLVPNCELGHLEVGGIEGEAFASSAARTRDNLSWVEWSAGLGRYLRAVEDLLWPDLIVVGGGVSKKADRFLPLLELRTPVVAAKLRNEAGIIGAAVLGATRS
ncbi:MAG TPA: ROK family protein [Acidimicrobiales bacterium]|nr:ROK family protein [Acidimicrobiales bacterium]